MEFPKVSIIIPYFQKEKGILRKSVDSILEQKNYKNYEVIIIDDGAPVPAIDEIGDLLDKYPEMLKLIKQKNSGAGSARNKGLDNVSLNTKYVAFLDSDDAWTENHLENAIFALEKGYDCYFADIQAHTIRSDFSKIVNKYKSSIIDVKKNIYEFNSDLFTTLLSSWLIATPVFVYRYEKFPQIRFNSNLYNGQDLVFWLEIAKVTKKIVFSKNIDAILGKGINIWESAGWGSKRAIILQQNSMKVWKYVIHHFALDYEQINLVQKKLSVLRKNFVAVLLHNIRHGISTERKVLLQQFKIDVFTYIYFVPNVIRIVLNSLLK